MNRREMLIAISIVLSSSTFVHGQSDSTCAAYMEADAIFRESSEWNTIANMISDPEWGPIVDAIGVPTENKGFNAVVEERRQAYLKAYRGPVSNHRGVMWELLRRDRKGCRMKRFPMEGPGVALKPIREWTLEDHQAFVRFVRSGL